MANELLGCTRNAELGAARPLVFSKVETVETEDLESLSKPSARRACAGGKLLHDPYVGLVLGELYEIRELIGTGAWGNVYRAVHLSVGEQVAVKIVHKHLLKDESNLERFRREARLLGSFDSNGVVRIIDADVEPVPYIVMEYFDGVPLNLWLKKHGTMNPQMAMELFAQLCRCLSEAEKFNIVHRDLKPANILIRTFGNVVEAKIVDFGLAKCLDQDSSCGSRITATGEILGSPQYMPLEQFKGQSDHRSDIYALGCIMYEVLSGQQAFSAKCGLDYLQVHASKTPRRISQVNPQQKLPVGLEEVILKCMEKSPEKRYKSSKLCRQALKAVRHGLKPRYRHDDKFEKLKLMRNKLAAFVSHIRWGNRGSLACPANPKA